MNLPQLISASSFERFNLTLCTAVFDGDITSDMQAELNGQVNNFNQRSPGGPLKPRYLLAFQGNQIFFRQRSATEAPTRLHFAELIQELGIAFPDETAHHVLTQAPLPAQSAETPARVGTK